MRIMYIDDDPDDISIFKDALEDIDKTIECVCVRCPEEALRSLKSQKLPDIIFLDINMPLVNGKKLLESYKTNPLLQRIPVIMLSTSHNKAEVKECESLGACSYMVKPSNFLILVDQLKGIIKEHAKRE